MKNCLALLICLQSLFLQGQYFLFWHDEFDSNQLDSTKWKYDIGAGGWGNNEMQYYTNLTSNSNITNGNLVITALDQNFGTSQYTSARVITKDLFAFKYGRIEARIKLPMGPGLWPAFWMLGANIDSQIWPTCGEIDIMEHINSESKIYGTMHFDSLGHRYRGGQFNCDPTQYHQYAVIWDSTKITWLVDNVVYHEQAIFNGSLNKEEFVKPFFLLLNIAVGGNWPGGPNQNTLFPASMYVDYVRVYKDQSELSINEEGLKDITISPNPTTGIVNIEGLNLSSIILQTMDGKIAFQEFSMESNVVDFSQLPNGVYIIYAETTTGNTVTKRLIKE